MYASELIGGFIGCGIDFLVIVGIGSAIALLTFGKRNPVTLRPFVFTLLVCVAVWVVSRLFLAQSFRAPDVIVLLVGSPIAFFIIRGRVKKRLRKE